MFSPIAFPIENFPGWLAAAHRVLPFWHMANVVRALLTQGLVDAVWALLPGARGLDAGDLAARRLGGPAQALISRPCPDGRSSPATRSPRPGRVRPLTQSESGAGGDLADPAASLPSPATMLSRTTAPTPGRAGAAVVVDLHREAAERGRDARRRAAPPPRRSLPPPPPGSARGSPRSRPRWLPSSWSAVSLAAGLSRGYASPPTGRPTACAHRPRGLSRRQGSLPGRHLMEQPRLGYCSAGTGSAGEYGIDGAAQVVPGDGHGAAGAARVELAAVDQAVLRIEQEEVGGAGGGVRPGHVLGSS